MRSKRWPALLLAGLGVSLTTLSGCQTWTSGMTLPSGRYLQHPPQYFPPSPPFPLPRELAAQERAYAQTPEGAAVAPLPAPLNQSGAGAGAGGDPMPLPPPGPGGM